ncbi:AraC family transcriptional regulator [Novosphingobium sp. B 225]|uniref:AraC family transcriptional regulator n=1 Tax=Novosphingobium sp. B 225 TaxID=1961849 RepID=UPI00112500AF|nr:AraC family transcriptional regulator [Novosphingobium sp. B 225]
MELVRAATLTGYLELAAQFRLDPLPLLRGAGLSRSVIAEPDRMIPARSVIHLLEESARAAHCPTFALRMALRRTVADLGLVSLLIAHQPSLREAFAVMQRYRNRINSTLVLQLEERGGVAVLHESWALEPPLVSRQSDELALGVLAGIGQWLLGPAWRVEEVRFAHAAPAVGEMPVYARAFGAPVRFGSDFVGLVLDSGVLDLPNPRADPALAAHAGAMAQAMIEGAPRSIEQEVEEALLQQLPVNGASLPVTARALGLNPRTLQRRLEAAGQPFAALLERVRRQQAARHLANPRLSLTQVAELTGYASLSAFTRWYNSSHGLAPSRARAKALASGEIFRQNARGG